MEANPNSTPRRVPGAGVSPAGVRPQASNRSTIQRVRNDVLCRYSKAFARTRSRTNGTLPYPPLTNIPPAFNVIVNTS